MYNEVKQLTEQKTQNASTAVKNNKGIILTDPDEVKIRWKEYIEELYDKDGKPREEDLNLEQEQNIDEDQKGPDILSSELREGLELMKTKKSEGIDAIPAEY